MSDMKKLCGLWLNTSKKDGKKYMAGKTDDGRKFLIFKNDKQGNEKRPDYTLFETDADARPARTASTSADEADPLMTEDDNVPL